MEQSVVERQLELFDVEPAKRCKLCKVVKPLENFREVYYYKKGIKKKKIIYPWCTTCDYARMKAYNIRSKNKDPEKYRLRRKSYRMKNEYGITMDDYIKMRDAQGGVCAVCGNHETKKCGGIVQPLSVDHDHSSNKIRGLLCDACNVMIGRARDDPAVLRNAAKYLDYWKENHRETLP